MGTLADEVALFWGITSIPSCCRLMGIKSVHWTQILLNKDTDSFTLSNGWAFPWRIYFDGENCEMPLPDTFPELPNGISSLKPTYCKIIILIVFTFITLVTWFWWIKYPDWLTSSIFFFSRTTKWLMMYYLFTSSVHEILCICESFPFLCTRESVHFIS